MAATITIRVFTGAPAGVMSGVQTGIDMISDDNDTNTPANRTSNPLVAGDRSYEKWIVARIDVAPDNWANDFHLWGDGGVEADTDLFYGFTAVYAQPTDADSVIAINDWTAAIVAAKANWHTAGGGQANLVNIADLTRYAVFQLDIAGGHAGGNWTQEVMNYDYTEA